MINSELVAYYNLRLSSVTLITVPLDIHILFTLVKKMFVPWNPVNPVTNGPQKSGRVNRVIVLKGFFK